MTEILLQRNGEDETIENPEYVSVLLNINKVGVDGDIYKDVEAVTWIGGE